MQACSPPTNKQASSVVTGSQLRSRGGLRLPPLSQQHPAALRPDTSCIFKCHALNLLRQHLEPALDGSAETSQGCPGSGLQHLKVRMRCVCTVMQGLLQHDRTGHISLASLYALVCVGGQQPMGLDVPVMMKTLVSSSCAMTCWLGSTPSSTSSSPSSSRHRLPTQAFLCLNFLQPKRRSFFHR